MFKLLVKDSQGNILHEPRFKTSEEVEEHKLSILASDNPWRFPLKEPQQRDLLDENGEVVGSESYQDLDISFEIIDLSPESMGQASKEAEKVARLNDIKAIDLSKISTIAGLKAVVQLLINDKINN